MGPEEIAHRCRELARKRRLEKWPDGWKNFRAQDNGELSDLAALRARLAAVTNDRINDVLTGAVFLGHKSPAITDPLILNPETWFRDPVSGELWPGMDQPAFGIDVRSTSAQPGSERLYGDVKFVWEPNRLQILQPLACILAAGGKDADRARALCFTFLRSWMDANPPYKGVNWVSGIELAMRLVSVTLFVASLEHSALSSEESSLLKSFVAAHAHMLSMLPSLYSSANNHRVAEGAGLFFAGLLLKNIDKAVQYTQQGQRIIEEEINLQIHCDGVGAEQSPAYQAFTMELAIFSALLAKDHNHPFSAQTLERLSRGAQFLMDMHFSDGRIHAIGDDDEGRVIASPHVDEPSYVASVASCAASFCGDRLIGAPPGYLRESIFKVALGGDRPADDRMNVYPDGGYTILSKYVRRKNIHLVFDHGPLGYLSLAAHGHSDALAIWLAVDGQPVFIDAGTWLYHSGKSLRNLFRSSQSHNSLSITGMSQSVPSTAFNWSNKARAALCAPDPDLVTPPAAWSMAGEHDGYRARAGVTHRRDIIGRSNGFVVADRLTGSVIPRPVEIGFLCDPSLIVSAFENSVTLWRENENCRNFVLRLRAPRSFTINILRGGEANQSARYSPRFGVLRETARILLCGELGSQPCQTVIELDPSEAQIPGLDDG